MSQPRHKSGLARYRSGLGAALCLCLWLAAAAPAAELVDLSTTPGDLHILGIASSGYLGWSMASGDVNGDGYEDAIIGTPGGTPPGRSYAGRVFVLYGAAGGLSGVVDLSNTTVNRTVIDGPYTFAQVGYSVGSGDVNADGIDDILIGAPYAGTGGTVYVVFGRNTGAGAPALPATIDLNAPGSANLIVSSVVPADQLGISLTSGDVTGDGFGDLIIGLERADAGPSRANSGAVWVFKGSPSLTGTRGNSTWSHVIYGIDQNDYFGHDVAVGDVNGDGTDDLIASAMSADPGGLTPRSAAGEVYVLLGGIDLPDSSGAVLIDLKTDSSAVLIEGEASGDQLGVSLAVGDVNVDGFADMILGASGSDPGGRTDAGRVYVVYGDSLLGGRLDLAADAADIAILGEKAGDFLGLGLTVVNANGDGMDDLLLGAPYSTVGSQEQAGRAHLLYGDPWLPAEIDLAAPGTGDITYTGVDAYDNAGIAVVGADMAGNGVDDLLIAAPGGDPGGRIDAGEVYSAAGEPPYIGMSVPTAAFGFGQPLILSVQVDSTSGFKIVKAEVDVVYNPELLTWTAVNLAGTLIDGWSLSSMVVSGPGLDTLFISATAVSSAATETGVLLRVDFDVADVRHPVDPGLAFDVRLNGFRPPSLEIDIGSYFLVGHPGDVVVTTVAEPGDTLRLRVTDADANLDPATSDTVTVRVRNSATGEVEVVRLPELSVDDSVFFGAVYTAYGTAAGAAGDASLNVADDDSLVIEFVDSLSALGVTETRADTGYALLPLGDVDDNGQAQAFDAARILAHSVGLLALTGLDSLSANLDSQAPDGAISSYDAALVIQKRLGLLDRFPVQDAGSRNHPQPQAGAAAPKVTAAERPLSLSRHGDELFLEIDERRDIWSGDLFIEGLGVDVTLAEEAGQALLVSRRTEGGTRLAFVLGGPAQGPGSLLRLALAGPVDANVVLTEASINGGQIPVIISETPGEGIPDAARPVRFALHDNYPNPFNATTQIAFDLPLGAPVELALYNVTGQRVRTLVHEALPAGSHRVAWDGRDQLGRQVASGPYLYTLTAGPLTSSKRLILLK